jgi:hypothetical protein
MILVIASMWIAWLSWRLPPGSRRWRSVRPDWTWIGAQAARRGELGVGLEPVDAGDLPDQLGGDQHPDAALGQQLRRHRANEMGELVVQLIDGAGSARGPG